MAEHTIASAPTIAYKTCPDCGIQKPTTEFYKARSTKSGLNTYCKQCSDARKRAWTQSEKGRASRRRWYNNLRTNHPERYEQLKQWAKDDSKKHRAKRRAAKRVKQYGITSLQFESMRQRQDNKCAICFRELPENANVDHCHATNTVRGLLCGLCNTGLGCFRDSSELLSSAMRYLLRHKSH